MAYEDENYQQKKDLYDSLAQSFENYRNAYSSAGSWNKSVEQLKGVTMRLIGEDHLELTHHSYETTTVEGLERIKRDNPGEKFLGEVAKALKKEFKNTTGKTLTLSKIREMPLHLEKVSRLSAESSWMLGGSRGGSPLGKYLCRTRCVYEFSANL